MASTLVEIIGKDSTGAAFSSASGRIDGLANSASRLNGMLGAIGATAVVGALGSFVKSTIDAQDNLFKLSQKTGIAVQSLAGLGFAAEQSGVELEAVAKGVRKFSLLVAEAADASSGAALKLSQLGLSYKQLKDLSPEKQLLALSDALSKFSKEDRAVALTATLGAKMADLIPLLSQGSTGLGQLIEQGKKLNPVTERSAELSERYNDQVNVLGKSVSLLGQNMVMTLIPSLTRTADAMVKAGESGGFLGAALAGVKQLFTEAFGSPKILGDIGQIRREMLKTQDVISQMSAKKNSGSAFFDANALEFERVKLKELEGELRTAIATGRENAAVTNESAEGTKKFAIALDSVNPKKATEGLTKLSEAQKKAKEEQQLLNRQMSEGNSLAESVDPILKRNNALAKYVELLKAGALSQDHFNSLSTNAINDASKATGKHTESLAVLRSETAVTTDAVSQLWIQAGRNIQSTLSNSIFDFFDNGLDGMVRNLKSAVLRIVSELAALKIAESIGLAGMFGGQSGGGTASTLGMFAGMFGGRGGGAGTAGIFSNAGGAGTAFIGGKGTALGGSGRGGSAISGTTGSLMAIASMAGPYGIAAAAAFAAMKVLEKKYGDYELGKTAKFALKGYETISPMSYTVKALGLQTPEALIGKWLFGRSPYKLRQQSIQGDIGAGGLNGTITDVYRSKGGLFPKNKHLSYENEIPSEIIRDVDRSIKGIYKATHEYAKNMQLDVNLVDTYSKKIQVLSEKNKTLTTEKIGEMLGGLADEIAERALPEINKFKLTGESAGDAFARLNNELVAMTDAAIDLGLSSAAAKDYVAGLGFEARMAFIEMAGGIDALSQKSSFFAENFLTEAERFKSSSEGLRETMAGLGFDAGMSIEQFKGLVQSFDKVNGISAETLNALLDLAPAFLKVKNASLDLAQSALGDLNLAVENKRNKLAEKYNNALTIQNKRILEVGDAVDRLRELSGALKSTMSAIRPLSLSNAQGQIQAAIATMQGGGIVNAADIQDALAKLTDKDTSSFSTSLDFQRSQAQSADLVSTLSGLADKQLTAEESALAALVSARDQLTAGFENEMKRLDLILTNAQLQLTELTAIKTLLEAQAIFAEAIPPTAPVKPISGNPNITGAQILNFSRANAADPMAIYKAAISNNVSSAQIAASGAFSQTQIDKFVLDNNLASFDVGSSFIPKTGLAMVHKGEQYINSSQNFDIAAGLRALVVEIKKVVISSGKTAELLDSVSGGGGAFLTEVAA